MIIIINATEAINKFKKNLNNGFAKSIKSDYSPNPSKTKRGMLQSRIERFVKANTPEKVVIDYYLPTADSGNTKIIFKYNGTQDTNMEKIAEIDFYN